MKDLQSSSQLLPDGKAGELSEQKGESSLDAAQLFPSCSQGKAMDVQMPPALISAKREIHPAPFCLFVTLCDLFLTHCIATAQPLLQQ